MPPISAKMQERFTPASYQDEEGNTPDDAPVYLISPPTYMTRARWRQAISDAGARYPSHGQLIDSLKAGIRETTEPGTEPGQRDELLNFVALFHERATELEEALREFRARWEDVDPESEEAADLPEPVIDALKEIQELRPRMEYLEGEMRRVYPPYAQLLSEQAYYLEVAPLIACAMFLQGWENVDAEFSRDLRGVPEAVLSHIPFDDVLAIGWRAINLTGTTPEQAKNSGGPSSSRGNRKRSTTRSKARGSSSTRKSTKTQETASRNGASTS